MKTKTTTETRHKVFMIFFGKWLEYDDAQMATTEIMQLIQQEKQDLLEDLLKKGHGGGNWRRLIDIHLGHAKEEPRQNETETFI